MEDNDWCVECQSRSTIIMAAFVSALNGAALSDPSASPNLARPAAMQPGSFRERSGLRRVAHVRRSSRAPRRRIAGEENVRSTARPAGAPCHMILEPPGADYDVTWDVPTTTGSFGNVWFGTQISTGEQVVLKQANSDPVANDLFSQEVYINKKLAALSAKVSPAYWPEFLGCTEYKSQQVIVWRKAGSGDTLDHLLSSRPLDAVYATLGVSAPVSAQVRTGLFRKVIGELLLAVVQIQSAGIYHRDIKPENVIVVETDPDAPLKLIDFGSSVDWSTPFKKGLGTATMDPLYGAPERRISVMNPDRFDVFSLGLIGVKCLCPDLSADSALLQFKNQLERYNYDLVTYCNAAGASSGITAVLNDPEGQSAFKLLAGMLSGNPARRITAQKALDSGYFF
ncbi:Serine/threonine-protein kinase STN7, chloroplastic [Porphyridium purpureum]|uniref:Serine/threonine-protein kinase STN7, chloroplastic n=1 Tax=Porphyridium purpureum TaxID=35688 RepID=A0A5J4YXU0_PORPP|nr:Serine/threonine-protein kinase STN7, chloroplastic [Porphyridium purpureum]|eukprot:POR9320..scf209_3